MYTVFVLGPDEGYRVNTALRLRGVPKGEAQGDSQRRRAKIDRIHQVESLYGQYNILKNYYGNDFLINLIDNNPVNSLRSVL